jgi:short-subunit dehydrogenase
MAVYGATKAFVLSFSQALAEEVAADGVTVLALCPGATATGFQSTAGVWEEARDTMHTPEQVVEQALHAFERGKLWLVPGFTNRLMAFFSSRLIPRRIVLRLAGRMVDAHRSPTTHNTRR